MSFLVNMLCLDAENTLKYVEKCSEFFGSTMLILVRTL